MSVLGGRYFRKNYNVEGNPFCSIDTSKKCGLECNNRIYCDMSPSQLHSESKPLLSLDNIAAQARLADDLPAEGTNTGTHKTKKLRGNIQ